MSVFRAVSSVLALALCALPGPGWAAPERVVSINLCTDQLAMLLAAPGQLISISHLARDPRSSAMAGESAAYPVNRASAEEVFLLAPDLVLAGSFTAPATLALLDRLGVPVVRLPPASTLDDVGAHLRLIGAALGHEDVAEELAARFETELAVLRVSPDHRPRAALYGANGYSSGVQSLPGQVLQAAGFDNVATELGMDGGGMLALEQLILADPDLVIGGTRYPGHSRSEDVPRHPALRDLRAGGAGLSDADWVCGTPHVLQAVARLIAAREGLTP